MATPAQRLTAVETAIAAIEGGAQSYTLDGVAVERADLSTLYAQRQQLDREVSLAANKRSVVVGVNFSQMGYD
jgi:hypothetical protein